jgi:hypothetical protein
MTDLVTTVLKLKDCGHDEFWLRDKIYDDPSILGLGDLQPVMKEKTQSQGGRLDLLLKDPSDDSMFEVELQLGETDPSHIVRTIEYWDNEKRRWPNRSHTAVLVAERITTRFFNVVQLLSKAVPIIGVQANTVQVGEVKALHFSTVIDSYQEPEEEEILEETTEKYWLGSYPAALDCAHWYRDLLARFCGDVRMKFGKTVITLYVGGVVRVAVFPKEAERAVVTVSKINEDDLGEAEAYLNREGVAFTRKGPRLKFTGNVQQLKDKQAAHEWIVQRLVAQQVVNGNS